jgi:hypothetical protein
MNHVNQNDIEQKCWGKMKKKLQKLVDKFRLDLFRIDKNGIL